MGLPAYQETLTSPPPYSSIESPQTITCTCGRKTEPKEDNHKTIKQKFLWTILHGAFIGIIIGSLATLLAVVSQLAASRGIAIYIICILVVICIGQTVKGSKYCWEMMQKCCNIWLFLWRCWTYSFGYFVTIWWGVTMPMTVFYSMSMTVFPSNVYGSV